MKSSSTQRLAFLITSTGWGGLEMNVLKLGAELKQELNTKLEEFATTSDTIEEISENKEQIEISKFYERLPNTPIIAANEYLNDEVQWRYAEEKE